MQVKIFDGHSDLLTILAKDYRRNGKVDFSHRYRSLFQQGNVQGSILVAWADRTLPVPLAKQIIDSFAVAELLATTDESVIQVRNGIELMQAIQGDKWYYLLGVEGLDGLEAYPQLLDWFLTQGVRHVGITWNEDNGFASGVHGTAAQGLTAAGKKLVKDIDRHYPFVLDVSHLHATSFWDVLALVEKPVIASHANSYTLCPVPRNLRDDQLRALAEVGGVVGVNSYPPFVADVSEKQNLQRLADHVEYLVELIGINHVGCGFDYNYWSNDGEQLVLSDLAHVGQSMNLFAELQRRGYPKEALDKIAGENFLRVLQQRLA